MLKNRLTFWRKLNDTEKKEEAVSKLVKNVRSSNKRKKNKDITDKITTNQQK